MGRVCQCVSSVCECLRQKGEVGSERYSDNLLDDLPKYFQLVWRRRGRRNGDGVGVKLLSENLQEKLLTDFGSSARIMLFLF